MEISDDAREKALKVVWNSQMSFDAHVDQVAQLIMAERSRCLGHVYGLAESDNAAERVAKAIRSGK